MDEDTKTSSRLDRRVVELVPSLSRASVQKLIDEGRVKVDNETQTKAGYKVKHGSKIKVDYDPDNLPAIPNIDLQVIYEDDDCVVIDKPLGVLSHSKGAFNPEATVSSWLLPRTKEFDRSDRTGIVHRLDRATSGVMICAKHPEALTWLQKQFSQRKVKKAYIAVIIGDIDPAEAIIDMPIERNPASPQRFRAGINGKPATTHYKTKQTFIYKDKKYSLLELKPTTGRTHQLRVHLMQLKRPIVGDSFYNGQPADRLYLHAHSLELTLPNKKRQVFVSKLPPDFMKPEIVTLKKAKK